MVGYHGTIATAIGILLLSALVPSVAQAPEEPANGPRPHAIPAVPEVPRLPDTPEAYGIVFDAWLAQHRASTAVVVVRRGGRTVFLKGHGSDPEKPTLLASLSKMITGVCLATLVRDGKVAFAMPMREALAEFFERHGSPADPRFESVTVEQLLVHRSGLAGNPDGDPMNRVWREQAQRGKSHLAAPQPLLAQHLKRPLLREPGSRYAYSNTGYVALTAIIEEKAGKTYEDYCREAVFEPLGIAGARLDPDWRQYSGAGGWILPGADYLALLDVFDPANDFLSEQVKSWIDRSHFTWDSGNRGGWYSLGVFTSAAAGRWRVSHGGLLNSRGKDASGNPTAAIVSSFAYRRADGTGVFVAMTPAQPRGSPLLGALRHELDRAHSVVTKLP
jgi:CubicO group peptidase (beta-lactamase class C family)